MLTLTQELEINIREIVTWNVNMIAQEDYTTTRQDTIKLLLIAKESIQIQNQNVQIQAIVALSKLLGTDDEQLLSQMESGGTIKQIMSILDSHT